MAQERTLEVAREELEVTKREVETGRVRVKKIVREEEKLVEDRLRRHEAEIKRVPVNRIISEPVAARYEGDTLVVPVLEEIMVKQWIVREEIRIRRKPVDVPHQERVVLKTEEVIVERDEAPQTSGSVMQPDPKERS